MRSMSESWSTRLERWKLNLFPASGAASTIRFRRPGRSRLTATLLLSPDVVAGIREELTRTPKLDRVFVIDLVDRDGVVHAVVEKTIHVSPRQPNS